MSNLAFADLKEKYSLPEARYTSHISTSIFKLNHWLGGGLEQGKLSEWGMPPGHDSRKILLSFLKSVPSFLWIYSQEQRGNIYPQTWESMGVNLKRSFFLRSESPLPELLPVFTQSEFPVIIIDSPTKLSLGDKAFLSTQARRNRQHYILIRPFFLSNQLGNPYSYLRLNVSKDHNKKDYHIKLQRGVSLSKNLLLNEHEVYF